MPPYSNSCDLKLDEIKCFDSIDDSECYLFLTKHNRVTAKVKINRQKIDLATSEIEWPVKKEKALFLLEDKASFPKAQLKAD